MASVKEDRINPGIESLIRQEIVNVLRKDKRECFDKLVKEILTDALRIENAAENEVVDVLGDDAGKVQIGGTTANQLVEEFIKNPDSPLVQSNQSDQNNNVQGDDTQARKQARERENALMELKYFWNTQDGARQPQEAFKQSATRMLQNWKFVSNLTASVEKFASEAMNNEELMNRLKCAQNWLKVVTRVVNVGGRPQFVREMTIDRDTPSGYDYVTCLTKSGKKRYSVVFFNDKNLYHHRLPLKVPLCDMLSQSYLLWIYVLRNVMLSYNDNRLSRSSTNYRRNIEAWSTFILKRNISVFERRNQTNTDVNNEENDYIKKTLETAVDNLKNRTSSNEFEARALKELTLLLGGNDPLVEGKDEEPSEEVEQKDDNDDQVDDQGDDGSSSPLDLPDIFKSSKESLSTLVAPNNYRSYVLRHSNSVFCNYTLHTLGQTYKIGDVAFLFRHSEEMAMSRYSPWHQTLSSVSAIATSGVYDVENAPGSANAQEDDRRPPPQPHQVPFIDSITESSGEPLLLNAIERLWEYDSYLRS